MQRMVVIGGGAAGSAVVGELLRRNRPGDIDLTWLVGHVAPGRGIAYSTPAEHHLLNVRAAGMGLFADDASAFIQFATAQGWPVKGLDFVPRSWFGDYVEAVLAREIGAARERGVSLRVVSSEAVAINGNDAEGYAVATADGELVGADGVVLAIGGLPPEPLAVVSAAAKTSNIFSADPWHWPEPAVAPERVVVLGTGLSAVDVLQSAYRRWPNAQLTAISRHGQLPQTHLGAPAQPYEHQARLVEAMRAQPNIRHWVREVHEAISEEGVDWRSVVDGLRPELQSLWRTLDLRERQRFLRHLRWLWESARHRLPPQTIAEISRLRTQGRLKVVAGHVLSVDTPARSDKKQLEVRIRPRGAETTRAFAAEFVIQATGFNLAASSSGHALIRQMIDAGIAQPDTLDLGLAADDAGRLLTRDGTYARGLRSLGSLLRGSIWECSGLPEIRQLAKIIARDLPTELRASRQDEATRASSAARSNLAMV